jgi:outer membrane protein assembly factor BamB
MKPATALRSVCTLVSVISLAASFSAPAEDWPQWRGPNRTGISTETGWQTQWPAEGPKQVWTASLGVGWSSFSVADGRVFTMGNENEVDKVYCFDAATGKPLWTHSYDCSSKDPNGYPGTRCTPTVDGALVYTVSRQGNIFCLDAKTGAVKWSKDFKKDFGSKPPTWGFSGSPLIEKDWVLFEVGGKGASVVAFDKKTGEVVWKNGDDEPAYSSFIAFNLGGERCFPQFSKDQIIGRRMKDGQELWRQPWKTSYGVNSATPIIDGDAMFISSGYGFGCALLKMSKDSATEVWRNKAMRNHVNSCVLLDGHLYGFDDSKLKCIELKTGTEKWVQEQYGKGSLMLAGGKFIIYSGSGKLASAELTPEGCKEISGFQVLKDKDTWAPPVLANGKIFVRSRNQMVCLDVSGK